MNGAGDPVTIEATAALAAVSSQDRGALALVSWQTEPGRHDAYDLAIVTREAWQAWWPDPRNAPPAVLWWTSTRSRGAVAWELDRNGIVEFGSTPLPETLAAPLRAHVRAPRAVFCDYCGAPVSGDSCRFCGTRRGAR